MESELWPHRHRSTRTIIGTIVSTIATTASPDEDDLPGLAGPGIKTIFERKYLKIQP